MVVVAHDHIGIELPPAALRRFKDRALKGFPRLVVSKEVLAVVPAADDMVNGSWILDALLTWHEDEASHEAGDWSNLYILRLTPFVP